MQTLEGHAYPVLRVVWLNQGLQFASTSSEGAVKIWNVKKSTCVNTFTQHEDKIWALDVHGSRMLTGGTDS